jgi:hypothetical protein
MNLLQLDRHDEELLAESFAGLVVKAGQKVIEDPTGPGELPNWVRMQAAFPGLPADLRAAANADRAEHATAL